MAMDGEARERLIIWLRKRIAEYGIRWEDLAAPSPAPGQKIVLERTSRAATVPASTKAPQQPDWRQSADKLGLSAAFFERPGHSNRAHVT